MIRQLIGRGIGFLPASVAYLIRLGLSSPPLAPGNYPVVLDALDFAHVQTDELEVP